MFLPIFTKFSEGRYEMVKITDGTKKPVSMVLKQDHQRIGQELSDAEKEKVYQAFRRRVLEKSQHNYVDLGETPKLLRLLLLGTKFNSTVEFLVKVDSFQPMMGSSKGTEHTEIGFTVELKSPLRRKTHTLEVLRRQFKATLIIPDGVSTPFWDDTHNNEKGIRALFRCLDFPIWWLVATTSCTVFTTAGCDFYLQSDMLLCEICLKSWGNIFEHLQLRLRDISWVCLELQDLPFLCFLDACTKGFFEKRTFVWREFERV